MAQYQEEQVRRRYETANPLVHRVESRKPCCGPSTSALNQIQQQQQKLEHLRRDRQVGGGRSVRV
uniref:Uncharacterized protein n=1 Tax=Peronospora matthiolae TaxID=2874970 RepID=A0AAV1V8U4_9STRA